MAPSFVMAVRPDTKIRVYRVIKTPIAGPETLSPLCYGPAGGFPEGVCMSFNLMRGYIPPNGDMLNFSQITIPYPGFG